jgi:leucyl-tRNA synthetase
MLSLEVLDYVFLGKGEAPALSKKYGVEAALLEEMRGEFEYWMPVDLRVSGKDLIPNHLTFFIFQHTAVF